MHLRYGKKDTGDILIQCPYDNTHMILSKSFTGHLMKCRQNHPGHKMATCKFDHTHIVPKPELAHHHSECPSRYLLDRSLQLQAGGVGLTGDVKGPQIVAAFCEDTEENWDAEPAYTGSHALFNKKKKVEEAPATKPYIPPGANYASGSTERADQKQESGEEPVRRLPMAPSKAAQMSGSVGRGKPASSSQVYEYSVIQSMAGSGVGRGRGAPSQRAPLQPSVGIVRPLQQPKEDPVMATPDPVPSRSVPPPRGVGRGVARFARNNTQFPQAPGFSHQSPQVSGYSDQFPGSGYAAPPFSAPSFTQVRGVNPDMFAPGSLGTQLNAAQFDDDFPDLLQGQQAQQQKEEEELYLQQQRMWRQQLPQSNEAQQQQRNLQVQELQKQMLQLQLQRQQYRLSNPIAGQGFIAGLAQTDFIPRLPHSTGVMPTYQDSSAQGQAEAVPLPKGRGRGQGISNLRTPTSASFAETLQRPREGMVLVSTAEIQKDRTKDEVEIWCDAEEPQASALPPQGDNRQAVDAVSQWLSSQAQSDKEPTNGLKRKEKDFSQMTDEDLQKTKRKLEKKLKQIAVLEKKLSDGQKLSTEEESKLQKKREIVQDLDRISALLK